MDVTITPLPNKNYPIIQQLDCVPGLLILSPSGVPKRFSSSHLQYIVWPLERAAFFLPYLSFFSLKSACDDASSGSRSTSHESHGFAASTHPLPMQTSILEALNNTSPALRTCRLARISCHKVKVPKERKKEKKKPRQLNRDRDRRLMVGDGQR